MSPVADPRYPLGRFSSPDPITAQDIQTSIDAIAALPTELRAAVRDLTDAQFDTPYRQDGWTVRQLVHHIADSHMNAFIRMRKAMTENDPDIFAYNEKAWAELVDSRHAETELSLALIDPLHRRWAMMLRSITDSQWKRTFRHPERGSMRLDSNTLLYAWHGRHHVAHITALRSRERW